MYEISIYANFNYICALKAVGRIDASRLERVKREWSDMSTFFSKTSLQYCFQTLQTFIVYSAPLLFSFIHLTWLPFSHVFPTAKIHGFCPEIFFLFRCFRSLPILTLSICFILHCHSFPTLPLSPMPRLLLCLRSLLPPSLHTLSAVPVNGPPDLAQLLPGSTFAVIALSVSGSPALPDSEDFFFTLLKEQWWLFWQGSSDLLSIVQLYLTLPMLRRKPGLGLSALHTWA